MSDKRPLRIAPGADGVSIWSPELFGAPGAPRLRDFIARAFAVEDVAALEVRRADAFGRLRYAPAAEPQGVWRRLAAALRPEDSSAKESGGPIGASEASRLFLDQPPSLPLRVSRVGRALTTWRMRAEGADSVRLTHPILRRREAFLFRLEEELAGVFGVEDVRARGFSSDVLVRLDRRKISAERLARELETAWPAIFDGDAEPPSAKRLFAAGTLLTLAAAGQFAVPALRPVAVGAVVVYSAPNVANAVRQLQRGVVGLPALYSFGLGLMLLSGLPLTGTIMASLMQLWPYLTHRTIVNRQRRLFAAHRKRPVWARLEGGGGEVEVHVDELKPGDEVVVRAGEVVPVDGVALSGLATVVDPLGGAGGLQDVGPGDPIHAGAILRDGRLAIRVARAAAATSAAHIGAQLPYNAFRDLPSLFEAERIANRNARPALALAAINLLTARAPRFSQAVIRPDYVTAPRLSAQLTALHDLADGLRRGLLVRRPAVLDILPRIEVVAFDDGAKLDRRALEVARVAASEGSTDETLGLALSALGSNGSERAAALARFAAGRPQALRSDAHDLRRRPGAILFRDGRDRQIAIVTAAFLAEAGLELPKKLDVAKGADDTPAGRPLYVMAGGRPIGVVAFRRQGEAEARAVIAALSKAGPRLRFVHVSSQRKALARSAADAAGIEFAYGELDPDEKVSVLRGLGRRTLWVGDGAAPGARAAIAASDVSVSVGGLAGAPGDEADVLLLRGALSGLSDLASLGEAHRARLAGDYRAVYAANLVGVAGAFLANFGSLQSGLLSNLGSGVVYARHVRRLNVLIARIEAERERLAG